MPKYHFEIIDGFRLEDPVGLECPDDERAKIVARDIARQIAIDVSSAAERNVLVVDDAGGEVYQTPIKNNDH
jgi:hypothetical protein